jgi:bifunctional non-homologous end joining protein LigD
MSIINIADVTITHPDKVLYPDFGITKLDIAKYYEKVAPLILPHLQNRPVSLVRTPDGVNKFRFFQKHPTENFPDYIDRVKIQEKEKIGVYITIDQLNDIIYLVNLGVLEFHTWLAKLPNLENPDTIVFDFDPDSEAPYEYLVDAIDVLKEKLEKKKIKSFLKTSGGKGFHIMIPLKTKYTWEEVRDFSKGLAEELVKEFPEKFTLEMKKVDRKGKVFIDYLRNSRGATNVCAFSTRAYKNAPISAPISWQEYISVKPDEININNKIDQDAWKTYFETENDF